MRARSDSYLTKEDLSYIGRGTYLGLVLKTVEDGQVDERELARLRWCESTFGLAPDFVTEARVEGLTKVFLEAVADQMLTDKEEADLRHVRERLGIPADAVSDMQQTIDELAEVRRIQQGQLTPIDTDQKLQRQEICYFEGPGRLLKSVILQSFRRDGVRYKVRGLEIDKEGTLLITSKRVTLRHEGT